MPGTEMHARAPPEGTNGDPTAPPAKDFDHGHGLKEPADDEEKAAPGFRAIKVPDEEDLSDGINDPSNMDVDHFLKRVGCGDPRLKAPGPDDEAWPPLPEGVQEVRGSYFRDPDFAVGVGGAQADGDEAPKTYVDLLTEVMERLGLAVRRGAGARAARVVGNSLLAATGIGAFYVAKKTRRLQPGEVAFYVDKNLKPHYVRGGWSLESNPFHGSFTKYDTDTDYIEFQGVVHVVRVRPGHYVRGVRNGHPILLKSGARNEVGVHVVVDPSFSLVGRMGAPGPGSAVVRSDADHVDANPLHIIMVPPEKVVAISIDRRPYVLFPGRHVLESSTLLVHAQQGYSLTQAFSVNSLLHSYPVYPGQLGCVKLEDEACFVDRPMHLWFYSPHAELMPVRPLEEEVVSFASLTRLVLDDYRRALIRNASGSLVTLSPGVHVCRRPVIHLASFSSEWYQARMPISAVTADPLDVVLTATMSYRVVDVASFYKAGDPERTHNDVREMAKSTMSEIVRSMRFEETLRQYGGPDTGRELHLEEKGGVAVERKLEGEDIDEVAPVELIRSQWQHASREHTSRFANFLRTTFGIELDLDTWQFCDFDLKDQRHQEELTKAVYARSEARAERVRLDLTKETASVRQENAKIEADLLQYQQRLAAETKREVALIEVKAAQEVKDAQVAAEFARKEKLREIEIADAKAKADAAYYETQRRADAEAYAITAKAEAVRQLYELAPQEFELELRRIQKDTVSGMKPHVFLGDAGGASLQKALALMVGRMSGAMAEENGAGAGE